MSLAPADEKLIRAELGREPSEAERALFENLWSEHCAYRSSRPLLSAFESESESEARSASDGHGERGDPWEPVVVGPGDDAAVVALSSADADSERGRDRADEVYATLGIESHNPPSYVDPFDGAATGVGGIVRDTLSMGAYPVALADSLYFGGFDREHSKYLFEGVVEGISHYGNCIGVPTVAGSVAFDDGYEGNPLVNVACVGLTTPDRLVTATAETPGDALVLVGNATGRDGLGGASFASEDLGEDAETEDRPAVQVGDPYAEKRLIECNEALVDEGLPVAARDLGAAGLGGASSELVAKGGLGAEIALDRVHRREPNMNATEILLAESQERMVYEVRPEDTDRVAELAERFDLGCSVIGEVTDGDYVCTFEGETVVDAPAEYLADGAPMNDLERTEPSQPERDLPTLVDGSGDPAPDALGSAFEAVVGDPTTASKRWVYRQYDHEVGVRTAVPPGDDAAVLAVREVESASGEPLGLAVASGSEPRWTAAAPYEGARAVALETVTNLAAKGATPLAAVDCLNGGNPEKPDVYGGFAVAVDGLAEMCASLSLPVVGGNVSLYNDSAAGPIPPTPTLAAVGTKAGVSAPPATLSGEGTLLHVGAPGGALGGSRYLAHAGGSDRFPALPENAPAVVETLAAVADADATLAVHDVSHGGLAVTLAEMVTEEAGVAVEIDDALALFDETPGRAVIETIDPEAVREAFDGVAPVKELGSATADGRLSVTVDGETLSHDAASIRDLRGVIGRELD